MTARNWRDSGRYPEMAQWISEVGRYLVDWARQKVAQIERHQYTPFTDPQRAALFADIVDTFKADTSLSWPEYTARIDNGSTGIWITYADTLLASPVAHGSVERFAAATGLSVEMIRAHGITCYNSATGHPLHRLTVNPKS